MTALVLLLVVGSAIWVGADANGRDFSDSSIARSTGGWVLGTLLLWLVFFPLYLGARGRAPRTRRAGAHGQSTIASAADGHVVSTSLIAGSGHVADALAYRPCPDCAEPIRIAARKCRFCGLELVDR